ncbi:type II toxin-antitoxin system toxin DNA ADP-ribosyl transferase DarT [Chryseobacterium aquaticum]|uniref:DarT domain-containing protein n=1 Tax=Chryseobacterium aquaticum subsp. greenlandense TaxID=345663 RepID=A0A101CJT9_9FLAO|nr:DUF4433 domain-containing protein [Chryseobacterium aquaticum]KUJ57576.1 hypothetical protein AR686_02065 [Chryseobacterium aquaticum subsp. greenlandense]
MAELDKIYLFRMTHIDNIPHILQYGITHSSSKNANAKFVPIGDNTIINTRNNFLLNNGKRLGEYIPFYFSERTPMLYVIQKGYNSVAVTQAEKIVYCVSSIQKIVDQKLDFIFTDGQANSRLSSQFTILDIENVNKIIDKKAIKDTYWDDEKDLDKKRRKEAEFLIHNDIDIAAILGYVVYNENAKKRMTDFGVNESQISVKSNYYF